MKESCRREKSAITFPHFISSVTYYYLDVSEDVSVKQSLRWKFYASCNRKAGETIALHVISIDKRDGLLYIICAIFDISQKAF